MAIRDEEGRLQIAGRMDDVINIAGHRISTAEIEDCVSTHSSVSESAVISIPHDIKGTGYRTSLANPDVPADPDGPWILLDVPNGENGSGILD